MRTLPEAVIFDMDGVLFDTERLYQEAAPLACADLGYTLPPGLVDATVGLSWEGTRALFADAFGPSFPVEAFVSGWIQRVDELSATQPITKPGVRELLATLDELGMPHAIATGSAHSVVQQLLFRSALTDHFPVVIAQGDYTEGKPAPDPFLKAAERLRVPPARCLAVEDSLNGVRSAVAAGMMPIIVPDLIPATDEMRALCVHVAEDLHEISTLLRIKAGLR